MHTNAHIISDISCTYIHCNKVHRSENMRSGRKEERKDRNCGKDRDKRREIKRDKENE